VSHTVRLPRFLPALLLAVLVLIPIATGVGGYWVSYGNVPPAYSKEVADRFHSYLTQQTAEVASLKRLSEEQFYALTVKLADAQARLVRLDALGERLVDVAGIESDEFDFGGAGELA